MALSFVASPSFTHPVAEVNVKLSLPLRDVEDIPNRFISSSENGFILSRPHEMGWKCLVQDGTVSLEWDFEST